MPGSKRAVEKQVLLLGDFVDLLFVNWESTQQVVMPYKNRCMFCCVFLVDFSLFLELSRLLHHLAVVTHQPTPTLGAACVEIFTVRHTDR